MYRPEAWFWVVAGDHSKVWSSQHGCYLPAVHPEFSTWVEQGHTPTAILNEAELSDVLAAQCPGAARPT